MENPSMEQAYAPDDATSKDLQSMSIILHDDFPRTPEPDLHTHQGPGVVSKWGYWIITDTRTGQAMYAHA